MASPPSLSNLSHKAMDNNGYADNVHWDALGFGMGPTDYMYISKCSKDGDSFTEGELKPYGNIELTPCAGVLNYGQGMKAIKRKDGQIVLFRPDQNALRMRVGAERMCLPCPSIAQFTHAVEQTALANKRWEGNSPLNLYVEDEYDRASRGGAGGVKAISNYGPAMKPLTRAKSRGFSDVLFLDSMSGKFVEEASSSNIFMVKNNILSTPPLNGTILPGVTRKTIMEIARDHGYKVKERLIPIEELLEADEVFCTGTATVVTLVGSITYKGRRVEYRTDGSSVSKKLLSTYVGIQSGLIEDKKGWVVEIN